MATFNGNSLLYQQYFHVHQYLTATAGEFSLVFLITTFTGVSARTSCLDRFRDEVEASGRVSFVVVRSCSLYNYYT